MSCLGEGDDDMGNKIWKVSTGARSKQVAARFLCTARGMLSTRRFCHNNPSIYTLEDLEGFDEWILNMIRWKRMEKGSSFKYALLLGILFIKCSLSCQRWGEKMLMKNNCAATLNKKVSHYHES